VTPGISARLGGGANDVVIGKNKRRPPGRRRERGRRRRRDAADSSLDRDAELTLGDGNNTFALAASGAAGDGDV
jgi:hypothetical protein